MKKEVGEQYTRACSKKHVSWPGQDRGSQMCLLCPHLTVYRLAVCPRKWENRYVSVNTSQSLSKHVNFSLRLHGDSDKKTNQPRFSVYYQWLWEIARGWHDPFLWFVSFSLQKKAIASHNKYIMELTVWFQSHWLYHINEKIKSLLSRSLMENN